MKRDTARQRAILNPSQMTLLLCTALVACDGSVQLCGEYACLFYQNDAQNNSQSDFQTSVQYGNQNESQSGIQFDAQLECDNTLFPPSNCAQAIRQCEAAGSVRDRAPDILNRLREANRVCAGQSAALNTSSASSLLVWDDKLAQASTKHARNMAAFGFESFTGSNGLSTNDRVLAAGFTASIVVESLDTGPQTVAEVINSWLDIPTDCEQLLDPQTTRIGMACELPEPATSGPYWSLLLATPAE